VLSEKAAVLRHDELYVIVGLLVFIDDMMQLLACLSRADQLIYSYKTGAVTPCILTIPAAMFIMLHLDLLDQVCLFTYSKCLPRAPPCRFFDWR
jgi:hypothetical protein